MYPSAAFDIAFNIQWTNAVEFALDLNDQNKIDEFDRQIKIFQDLKNEMVNLSNNSNSQLYKTKMMAQTNFKSFQIDTLINLKELVRK